MDQILCPLENCHTTPLEQDSTLAPPGCSRIHSAPASSEPLHPHNALSATRSILGVYSAAHHSIIFSGDDGVFPCACPLGDVLVDPLEENLFNYLHTPAL